MKATTYLGTGLVALAFVFAGGCDSVEDVEDGDFVEPLPKVVQITEGADGAKIVSFRALADNGTEANGYRMNGYRMNGYRMNGYRMNGYRMNGYRMNGSALNNVFLNLFGVLQGDEGVMGENDEITLDSDNDVLEEDYEIKLSEQETVPGRSQFKFQRIRYRVKPGTTWDDACRDGYDNPTKGILVRYVFDEDTGEILDTPTDGTSWACRGTAMGKCIEWAWHPDDSGTDRFTNDTNVSFYDIYRACTRMVRADYNGNGTHHTQNGTPIDIEGRFGLQNHETLLADRGRVGSRRRAVPEQPAQDLPHPGGRRGQSAARRSRRAVRTTARSRT
ncbi:MAG: hypothetical protein H6713_05490 [Myxococcales bacterium]|nr:hypothetical protein [Myxococcales bacterium]